MTNTSSTRRKVLIFLAIDFVILIALAPTILSHTGLRDRIINSALANKAMSASTRSASLGYFSPLSIEGFDLQADDGSLEVKMEMMACEKSWLGMLVSGGDLGKIQFIQPSLSVVTQTSVEDEPKKTEETETARKPVKELPTFVAQVDDAEVVVRANDRPEPAINLDDLSFTIRTQPTEYGSLLSVDAVDLLSEEPLTPELCNQGVQLISPMFANSVSVEGKVSFRLDHCEIPVGDIERSQKLEQTEIEGVVGLTDVSVGLNSPIATQLVSLLQRFFDIDDNIRLTVSRSSQVQFSVVDGRVHHQGLAFLLPIAESDFQLASSGSVGFDETLDLEFTFALPEKVLGDGPIQQFLTSDPMAIQITGTTQEPIIRLASDQGWQSRLQKTLDGIGAQNGEGSSSITDSAGAVLDLVGGLLERDKDSQEGSEPGLLDRLNERRNERKEDESRRPGLLRRRRNPQ